MQALPINPPPNRRLRVFTFDPSMTTLEMAVINQTTLQIPWDCQDRNGESTLQVGPVNEYLEVIDYDPASGCFYAPVDLNDHRLLAQDGLPPSEANPQFHQQMVFAVAMTTLRCFETALGRVAFWAPLHLKESQPNGGSKYKEKFVQRLRIYPHALREANAYYSPAKKALLFGYFPATTSDVRNHLPGGTVFTCLSHDIIAHETTHALLDGLHPRFNEPTNPDMLAFHEAFADIVALFQHFSNPDVLRNQVAKTRGKLGDENLLAKLAVQFGRAIGEHNALRDALGTFEDGVWKAKEPDPLELETTLEPHKRGSILVGAVFDAFVVIYKKRIADLLRIATGGSGVLPPGDLHPDLVNRLAGEAAKAAGHVLTMCIRALDYCPPVDLTFGDYLRALITADRDLVPDDDLGYRLAVVEAFRRRGIYPRDVRSLSTESLCWMNPTDENFQDLCIDLGPKFQATVREWDLHSDREKLFDVLSGQRASLHGIIAKALQMAERPLHGLHLDTSNDESQATRKFEVHSVRPSHRVGPDGQTLAIVNVELTQRRRGYFDKDAQEQFGNTPFEQTQLEDKKPFIPVWRDIPEADFIFRGGCTLVIDLDSGRVRYAIYKDIDNEDRLERTRSFLSGDSSSGAEAYDFYSKVRDKQAEPFAALHRPGNEESEEWHD